MGRIFYREFSCSIAGLPGGLTCLVADDAAGHDRPPLLEEWRFPVGLATLDPPYNLPIVAVVREAAVAVAESAFETGIESG
jgi:hypothetical protein